MKNNYQYIKQLLLGKFSLWRTIAIILTQFLGVCLVSISVYFAFDVQSFFKASSSDDCYVILTQEVSALSDFMGVPSHIDSQTISDLEAMEGVKRVGEFTSSEFRVSGSLNMGSGGGVSTEMFFEAVDSSFIDVKSKEWSFDSQTSDFVPVIIPQNYVNLYNFGFSNSMGLPKLSKDLIGEVEFNLNLYDANFGGRQPRSFKGRVVGFSNRINTILAPLEFVEWANQVYGNNVNNEKKTSRLIVEIDPLKASDILAKTQQMGLESENQVSGYEEIGGVMSLVVLVVVVVGILITLLSVALLVMMLYVLVERNRAKIDNLRMLGFSKHDIFHPFQGVLQQFILYGVLAGWLFAILIRIVYISFVGDLVVGAENLQIDWVVPSLALAVVWILIYIVSLNLVSKRVNR